MEEGVYNEEYIEPDPVLGYDEQKEAGQKAYADLIRDGVSYDDKRIDIIQSFLAVIKSELDELEMQRLREMMAGVPMPQGKTPTQGAQGVQGQTPSVSQQAGMQKKLEQG